MPLYRLAIRLETSQGDVKYKSATVKARDPDGACHRIHAKIRPGIKRGKWTAYVVVGMALIEGGR